MTDQFWLGVIVGAITTFGLLIVWGLSRISKQRESALCRWCGGQQARPVVIEGDSCPSPFHQGLPDWNW